MAGKRGVHSAVFKAKVALAAVRGDKTLSELARQFSLHPTQISSWKQRLLEGADSLFGDGRRKRSEERADEQALYEQIGRLKVEADWLKKKAAQFDGREA